MAAGVRPPAPIETQAIDSEPEPTYDELMAFGPPKRRRRRSGPTQETLNREVRVVFVLTSASRDWWSAREINDRMADAFPDAPRRGYSSIRSILEALVSKGLLWRRDETVANQVWMKS